MDGKLPNKLNACANHYFYVLLHSIPWDDLGPNKKRLAIENMNGLKELIQSGFEMNLPDEIFNEID